MEIELYMNTPSSSSIMEIIKDKVTEKELQSSVVYIIPEIGPGEEFFINRKKVKSELPAHLLFVDLEPGVNWSHNCRYILLSNDNQVKMEINGQFPPETNKLQVLIKPANIEDWMLLTDKVFKDK